VGESASRQPAPRHGPAATPGIRVGDLAALIPAQPGTVRRWLRGTVRPSPKNAAALAGALEQLLGPRPAGRVLALIPERSQMRRQRRI
jgi:hypothetical protein